MLTAEQIAQVCHEANRGYQKASPAGPIPASDSWETFLAIDPVSAAGVIHGVKLALEGATPEQMHVSWCRAKIGDGWRYGEMKDSDKKTHPNLLPYGELSQKQRAKDELFLSIVRTLATPDNQPCPLCGGCAYLRLPAAYRLTTGVSPNRVIHVRGE